jgi:thiol-disulfide isomerase/thioredoxin
MKGSMRLLPILTALALVGAWPAAGTGGLPWEKSYGEALKKAKAAGRPVMIDFWADWCTWCHDLDRTTYVDSRVLDLATSVIPVKVDTEGGSKDRAITERYDIVELPTILFVTPGGNVVLRVQGFQGPDPFVGTLEKAREAAALVMAWEARIQASPNDAQGLARLGQHLFGQREPSASFDFLSRAARVDAESPAAERKRTRLILGILHARKKQFAMAEAAFQEALALPPARGLDPQLLLELERAYVDGERLDAARRVVQEIADGCPDSPFAAQAQDLLARAGGKK